LGDDLHPLLTFHKKWIIINYLIFNLFLKMKKVVLLTIHGMGNVYETYNHEFLCEIQRRLGEKYDEVFVGSIYYKNILKKNEERIWSGVEDILRWKGLRKFILYGFGDAAGLENGKYLDDGVYTKTQLIIARELYRAQKVAGVNAPVLIIAHSLGGHVISCYYWDAQIKYNGGSVNVGLWKDIMKYETEISVSDKLNDDIISYLQGRTFKALFTTGCNIPVFVAAHAREHVLPIKTMDKDFKWRNYYNANDVLGWPLATLSSEYAALVEDINVLKSEKFIDNTFRCWNPLSHNQYWRTGIVIDDVVSVLSKLLE
jgi:hypothetical protein